MAASLTIVECILLAAASLETSQNTFSAEDLVVRSWQLFPDRFGLQGYAEEYPDSNRVLTKLMDASGSLRKHGWIDRIGSKRYRLTEVGRNAAKDVEATNAGEDEGARLATLSRQYLGTLRRMLASSALRKYRNGEPLSFSDVASLWNISARSTASQLNLRVEESRAAVEAALKCMKGSSGVVPGAQNALARSDLQDLLTLFQRIGEDFEREIGVIRARTRER